MGLHLHKDEQNMNRTSNTPSSPIILASRCPNSRKGEVQNQNTEKYEKDLDFCFSFGSSRTSVSMLLNTLGK